MVDTICTIFTIRTILSFLKSFFDGYDTCGKHAHYFFCISIQAVKKFFIYVVCSLEKFKPIKRFVAFLLCDSQLVHKIRFAIIENAGSALWKTVLKENNAKGCKHTSMSQYRRRFISKLPTLLRYSLIRLFYNPVPFAF